LRQVEQILVVTPVAMMMVKSDRFALHHLKDITVGAAPVSAELESMLRKRFPGLERVRQGWYMFVSLSLIQANK
jgi:hypothetical protein